MSIHSKQRITPFLWYDGRAEEAIKFYTSIFPHSKINVLKHWGPGTPFPENWVSMGSFVLDGLQIYAFDAGPQFKFTEAISFFISCKDQEEVDYYWEKLTDGGSEQPCGWLKDKFGVSWQVVPEYLGHVMENGEPEKVQKVVECFMKMKKLDIAQMEEAYNG